jgi:hypothetical protein
MGSEQLGPLSYEEIQSILDSGKLPVVLPPFRRHDDNRPGTSTSPGMVNYFEAWPEAGQQPIDPGEEPSST